MLIGSHYAYKSRATLDQKDLFLVEKFRYLGCCLFDPTPKDGCCLLKELYFIYLLNKIEISHCRLANTLIDHIQKLGDDQRNVVYFWPSKSL